MSGDRHASTGVEVGVRSLFAGGIGDVEAALGRGGDPADEPGVSRTVLVEHARDGRQALAVHAPELEQVGSVEVPQEAFMAVLKIDE